MDFLNLAEMFTAAVLQKPAVCLLWGPGFKHYTVGNLSSTAINLALRRVRAPKSYGVVTTSWKVTDQLFVLWGAS